MQTVDKAMTLLGCFSEQRPEIGLTELARATGYDKATTRRLLVALGGHGVVEQDTASRRYRLGAGLLRLARVREATHPVSAVAAPLVDALAERTGETAHLSLATPKGLATVGVAESAHASRVTLEHGELLPVHATASGHAWLAFAEASRSQAARAAPRDAHTDRTPADEAALEAALATARRRGWALADQSYEDGVVGVAAPFFDVHGHALGAIGVATPVSRFTAAARTAIRGAVCAAAADLTRALGADVPRTVATAWSRA